MKNIIRFSACLTAFLPLLLLSASPCLADALRISVAQINTVNADASMGTVLENLLSEELHRHGEFILIDRKRAAVRGDAADAGMNADKIIT